MGHEFIGVVEESDGTCEFCRQGLQPSCLHGGRYGVDGVDGGQGEAVRVPQADGTLVVLPVDEDDALMPSVLTLSDMMATGHHAARAANVGPGKSVAVVGDGAVSLCGVIAAKRLGAEQIVILGRHPDRIELAKDFGATDVVSERGEAAVEHVRELTDGLGAHSVLECVGYEEATQTALAVPRPGGAVGVGPSSGRGDLRSGADVLRQRHDRRGPRSRAGVYRGAPARRARRQHRARPRLRPGHGPRRGARRVPGDERPGVDQGADRAPMSAWTSDELDSVGSADELRLASLRRDGTLRRAVTIWVVRVGDGLYVRSAYGRGSTWFRGVQDRHEGRISAGGVDKDVAFVEVDDVIDEIDAAYRAKYGGRYPASYVDPMVAPDAQAATLELQPR